MAYLGTDTSCVDGLRAGVLVTGRRLLAEALYRRITTPTGMLIGGPDEESYGIDVTDLVGSAGLRHAAVMLPGMAKAELEKDERVESATVTSTVIGTQPSQGIRLNIHVESSDGPFEFQVGVSELSAELLGVTI